MELCPQWNHIEPGDDRKAQMDLFECLDKLNEFDSPTLRCAIKQFLLSHENIDGWSKLFIVNRYVCDVPEWVPLAQGSSFSGFMGFPIEDGRVGLLWPLGKSASGRIVLIGHTAGYLGPSFLAVDEFDAFLKSYGRRAKDGIGRVTQKRVSHRIVHCLLTRAGKGR